MNETIEVYVHEGPLKGIVEIHEHSGLRIKERAKYADYQQWASEYLATATYISQTSDTKKPNQLRNLYESNGMRIYTTTDNRVVITVIPVGKAPAGVRNRVNDLLNRELRKAQRIENAARKRIDLMKAELAVEKASCVLRKRRTKSKAVENAMNARINAITERETELRDELKAICANRNELAKAITVYAKI